MKFTSKTEAYSYILSQLCKLKESSNNQENLNICIHNIKMCFENHEQNPEVVCHFLKKLLASSNPINKNVAVINTLIKATLESDYNQSLEEKCHWKYLS
jgi:hypothetical protein